MFAFKKLIQKFFQKNREIDGPSRGRWQASFKPRERHFSEEDEERYTVHLKSDILTLELRKDNLFAWTTAGFTRYDDFSLEAIFSFDRENGYSAAGFILRHINDENFYYFLLSNHGYFRFDLVFNGKPITLIPWTRIPDKKEKIEQAEVRIIARGEAFFFFFDDYWIGEINDSTIAGGHFGFAGQNYEDKPYAHFYLKSLIIESRPVVVEKIYLRWTTHIPIDPGHRMNLARSFFERGQYLAAAAQVRKLLKIRQGGAGEYSFLSECLVNLDSYAEALGYIERALDLEPGQRELLLKKANLLYLLNRLKETRDFIHSILAGFEDNQNLWNLLGNVEHALCNWKEALEAYSKAAELDPCNPLFLINTASVLEQVERRSEAFDSYLAAARILFRDQSLDELARLLPRIRRIDPQNRELAALEGKILYHEGKKEEAERIFRSLVSESSVEDSSVFFLFGLILSEGGQREEAVEYFRRADEMEPGVPVYLFRLAESLYLLGMDPGEELREAYRLKPDDPWINNLYGQYLMRIGKNSEASQFFARAIEAIENTSEETNLTDLVLNYSENLALTGETERALTMLNDVLKRGGRSSSLLNQKGNLLVRQGSYAAALEAYEQALEIDPEQPDYVRNCLLVCMELDMIQRGEELAARLLDLSPVSETYNLIAGLSLIKGEYERAETALREALAKNPNDHDTCLNLARLCIETGRAGKAEAVVTGVLAKYPESDRAREVLGRIRRKFKERLNCSNCGREWWIPKEVGKQPTKDFYGELPGECPAGRCESCQKIYCIECVRDTVVEKRFVCPDCGEFLKLSDDALKFLVSHYLEVHENIQ